MKTLALLCAVMFTFTGHWAMALTCPAGSYDDNGVCKLADPGYYVPVAGATSQTPCPPGTYTSGSGAITPAPADPGHYATGPGAASQTPCSPGTFAAGAGNASPTPAQPGFFVATSGASSQTPCAPGYYTSFSGAAAPTPASPGFYVPAPMSSSQIQAPGGFYAPGPAATSIVMCLAGSFAPAGSTAPTLCPLGTFTAVDGAATPTLAQPGYYVPTVGATSQTQCTPGYFTSLSGASVPSPAPAGFFVDVSGASSATPAPPGRYAPGPAATFTIPAPPGSYSPGSAAAPTPCPPGSYTPFAGMAAPIAAPPGYYVSVTGATSPVIVPAGNYAAGPGATGYLQSPAGYYAPAGSAAPILCPGGYYAGAGSATITICPAGSYAPAGSGTPIVSPPDFYAPEGSAAPIYCPGSLAGSTTCNPQGFTGSQLDFGDLPDSPYPTKLPNGARHVITPSLFLGAGAPDPEPDGQALASAKGDDNNGADDEDSVDVHALVAYKSQSFRLQVKCTNTTGNYAFLNAFADWNNDGDFGDADEVVQVTVPTATVGVGKIVVFNVPASAVLGTSTALRLRFSTDNGVSPSGLASNGEVEDYLLTVQGAGTDWSDLPDVASSANPSPGIWGTASPPNYPTLAVHGGPSHPIISGLNFANDSATSTDLPIDAETDGQPTSTANGDNINGDNDESILLSAVNSVIFTPDGPNSYLTVSLLTSLAVENITGSDAYVFGFIDLNSDGDFTDPGEQSPRITIPGDGTVHKVEPTFTFQIHSLTPGTPMSLTHGVRFRISHDPALAATGPATDGEVEDSYLSYTLNVPNFSTDQDFGDLPAPYPTLLANDGPRHLITPDLYIGADVPDAEGNGLPTIIASGDDDDSSDDEDGLIAPVIIAGGSNNLSVKTFNETGEKAYLWLFIDWNHDGDFADAGEALRRDALSGTRIITFAVDVPPNAITSSPTAIRLRLSLEAALGPVGYAPNGEVEDSFVAVHPQGELIDFGDLPDLLAGSASGTHGAPNSPDYKTKLSDGGPSHVLAPGIGFANLTPSSAAYVDGESDAFQSTDAKGDDNSGNDDENGIEVTYGALSTTVIKDGAFSEAVVTVQFRSAIWNATPSAANTAHFFDTNNNGSFEDLTDTVVRQSFTSSALSTFPPGVGNVGFVFDTAVLHFKDLPPGGGFIERTFAVRSRISTDAGMTSIGAASNGEVEDHVLKVQFFVDPADMANPDYGDLPDIYKTLHAVNGARHVITSDLYLGSKLADGENDGHPSTNALGDNGDADNDEDGLNAALVDAHAGFDLNLAVRATNNRPITAQLIAFVDWNADGMFNNTDEMSSAIIPPGSANVLFEIPFRVPLNATTTQPIAVRLRLSTALGLSSSGPAPDGEVEDYFIAQAKQILDYGDINDASGTTLSSAIGTAPGTVVDLSTVTQGNYRTMKYNLGPRHIGRQDLNFCLEALRPETQVDGEDDAHTTVDANGDDLDLGAPPNGGISPAPIGDNDEAGPYYSIVRQQFNPLSLEFTLTLYASVAIRNETGQPAFLKAFIDGNNDGDFDDTDESSITIVASPLDYSGVGPDFTIDRPDAMAGRQFRTPLASIPSTVPGIPPPAYGILFIVKAKLPPTDTGIRGFTKKLPIRLRLSTTPGLGSINTSLSDPIPDGEVEDQLVTFNASFDNPYPRTTDTINTIKLWSDLVDKNTNTRFNGFNHFPPNFYQAFNNTWHFDNGLSLQGNNPLVPASLMQNLPNGTVPYFHTAELFGQLAVHWGTVNFRDLGSYRTFMNQANHTDEDSAPMSDIDGDGVANYYEFAFGSDPAQPGSVPKFEPRLLPQTSGGNDGPPSAPSTYFVLPYLRRTGGSASGVTYTTPDVIYQPRASKDLLNWAEPIEATTSPSELPAPPVGYEWGAVRLPTPPESDPEMKGFIRVELSTP